MINHTGEGSTNKKTGVRAVEEWKMLRFLLGVTRMVFIINEYIRRTAQGSKITLERRG